MSERMAEHKTRLCIVTPYQSGGGAEYQIQCLLDVLIPTGQWDIHYLTRNPDPAGASHGLQVVKIGRGTGEPRFGHATDGWSLYAALRALRPDAIYQRVACGYTGICALYGRIHQVPVTWHVAHDTDVAPDSSIFGRNPVRRWIEKRSVGYGLRNVRNIVTQTHHQARLLQDNYGRTATAVIPNFHPAPEGHLDKSGEVTVVWIANLKAWKRPEIFVRLAASLPDLRFIMVGAAASGTGDREWAADLVRSIQATPNLRYLGPQDQQQVNDLLARSHILVNTSLAEGFSNTFIQAWMREVPVVSMDVDPDGLLGREGIGIRAGSESGLVRAVRQLATDPGARAAYGARARAYALAAHSLRNATQLGAIIAGDGGSSLDRNAASR